MRSTDLRRAGRRRAGPRRVLHDLVASVLLIDADLVKPVNLGG